MLAQARAPVSCAQLQGALDGAASGDTITLSAGGGLCGGNFSVPDKNLTLAGEAGAGFKATNGGRSITTTLITGSLTLQNLIFEGGTDGGARRAPDTSGGGMSFTGDGVLTIDGTIFRDIRSPVSGGGLRVAKGQGDGATVTLSNDQFLRDAAGPAGGGGGFNGGGARIDAAELTVTGTLFDSNQAASSGAGLAVTLTRPDAAPRAAAPPQATLTGNTFTLNQGGVGDRADAEGGGLFLGGDLVDECGGCRVARAQQRRAPGSLTATVGQNLYDRNVADAPFCDGGAGGGAYYEGVIVNATATETYSGNTAGGDAGDAAGGGFYVASQGAAAGSYTGVNTVVIDNVAIGHHAGECQPGGIARGAGIGVGGSDPATLTLVHPTIIHNRVTEERTDAIGTVLGPAIWGGGADTLHISRGLIFDNTAAQADSRRAALAVREVDGFATRDITKTLYCDDAPPTGGNICATPTFVNDHSAKQAADSPSIDKVASQDGNVTIDFEGEHRPSTQGAPRTRAANAATPWDMGADEFQFSGGGGGGGGTPTPSPSPTASPSPSPGASPTPTPTPTPTPKPRPTPKPKPHKPKGEHAHGRGHVCAGRRKFPIVLRNYPGRVYTGARFWLNGERIKTRRIHGRIGAIIDLRKLPRGRAVVRIVAFTNVGTLRGKRVYHPCHQKRKHTIPPL